MWLAACWAGAGLGPAACTAELTAANKKCTAGPGKVCCTPGVNVFCRCAGGQEEGTMQCQPGGESFGACLPCDGSTVGPDIITREPEDIVQDSAEPAADSGGQPDVAADSGSTASDAAPVKCQAFPVKLGSDKPASLGGDTSKAKATMAGLGACAVGNLSKDIVYEVVTAERGKVTAVVTPSSNFDPICYVRSGPCGTGDQNVCADKATAGGLEIATFFTEADEKHYVVVDGKNSAGSYALKLELTPGSYCGDGAIDPEEACDDGNQNGGDGCSSQCKPDGMPVSAQTCPGQEVHVWQLPVSVSAATDNNPNVEKAACGGGGGRDAIYQVVPHTTGIMTATVHSDIFDTVVYARSGACTPGQELACANKIKGNGDESISFPVESGVPAWVIVDGYKYGKGLFTLQLAPQ